jgi:hypothetical protein
MYYEKELRDLSPNSDIHVSKSNLYMYSQDRPTYMAAAKYVVRSWECINLSQIYECRDWETEHYNSVLEITRLYSFISGNT